ncbi:MAG: LysR family transcriptional regulator [Desulfofustis sp.]|nr:LysR family transcriptional regulator [Desulfofustis sp.]NNK14777.1 LysR family transcriptional regulator [Desulfofustis sp.]
MNLEDLQVVLKVAELRSITAAATHLDMSTPRASTALKRVEKALGVELFIRTTRRLCLSSAGERYIPKCEQALLKLDQARQEISSELAIVDGELRIATASDLGRNLVRPWLNEFMEIHPEVSVRLNLSDSNVDLFRDSIDIAIRYVRPGSLNDANLYGFKICKVPSLLCASPDYLDRHGIPLHPRDLPAHNGLLYELYDITNDVWTFTKGGEEFKAKMSSNRVANDGDLVRRWCIDGKGLAIKSCLEICTDLLSGKLVNVMSEFRPSLSELWFILPSRQLITPAVRLLRESIKKECNDILTQLTDNGNLDKGVLE